MKRDSTLGSIKQAVTRGRSSSPFKMDSTHRLFFNFFKKNLKILNINILLKKLYLLNFIINLLKNIYI